MILGVARIETWVTEGDENGIYRVTEQKHKYLLLAFEEADEARVVAKALARLLKVSYYDHIYTEPKLEGVTTYRVTSTAPNISNTAKSMKKQEVDIPGLTRPKRVMGAEKLCVEMLIEGTRTEEEIEGVFFDKYIQAGHRWVKAKQLASWVLHAAKKKVLSEVE